MIATVDRVYIHFDKLYEFMIKHLVDCQANHFAWGIAMSHISKLPQYKYRCDISQPSTMDILGIKSTVEDLKPALDSISHLLHEQASGIVVITPGAITQLAELGESQPIVIVRTSPPPPPPTKTKAKKPNKKDWGYANALFAGPNKKFYDFQIGNQVLKMAKKEFKDLDGFCAWRIEKKCPGLPIDFKDVKKDYEKYQTPPIDLAAMQPESAAPTPKYRKVELTN